MPTNIGFPPFGYNTPPWPSLYWTFSEKIGVNDPSVFLYLRADIVWFTIAWTLILFSILYGIAGLWGFSVFYRSPRKALFFFILYFAIGLGSGALAGGVVGGLLSAFYIAGFFPMPTWIPLSWAITSVLFVVIAGYPEVTLTTL